MGYKAATIRGIGWMGLLQFLSRVIAFIKIIIIAKLLSPRDIGLFAIVMMVVALVEIFSEIGIQTFLIQSVRDLKKVIGTAWFLILVRGIILFLIVLVSVFPAAIFFRSTTLIPLLVASSFIPLLKTLENPYVVTFQKHLHFRVEFLYKLLIALSDFCGSLLLVSVLHSAMGLVLGLELSIIVGIAVSWLFLKERPRFQVNRSVLREIGAFTKSIIPLNIANYLVNESDGFLLGRLSGVTTLGLYQVGQKFSSQPLIEVSDLLGKVTLPVYVKIGGNKKRLLRAYLRIVALLVACNIVFVGFLLLFSGLLISYLGSDWGGIAVLLPILISYGFVMAIWGTTGSLFFSVGKPHILARLAVIRLIITLPLLGAGIYYFQAIGAAWALLISIILLLPITLYYLVSFFSSKE